MTTPGGKEQRLSTASWHAPVPAGPTSSPHTRCTHKLSRRFELHRAKGPTSQPVNMTPNTIDSVPNATSCLCRVSTAARVRHHGLQCEAPWTTVRGRRGGTQATNSRTLMMLHHLASLFLSRVSMVMLHAAFAGRLRPGRGARAARGPMR